MSLALKEKKGDGSADDITRMGISFTWFPKRSVPLFRGYFDVIFTIDFASGTEVCSSREPYENYKINNNNGVCSRFLYGRIYNHRNVHCSLLLSKEAVYVAVGYVNAKGDERRRRGGEGGYVID